MRNIVIVVLSGLLLLILIYGLTTAQTISNTFDLERIQSATVFIVQAEMVEDNLVITCIGSGTVVSRDGLILTNAHHTVANTECPGEVLIIAFTTHPDSPPVPRFRAEVVQANIGVDLALLRVTQSLSGRLLDPETLSLPFVELADSSTVELDEDVFVVGYNGIGSDPVQLIQGTVTGFLDEPSSSGGSAWIKTSTSVPGSASGGGAYNRNGQLIGIPTTAPIAETGIATTCLPIQDTNGDGLVTGNDNCVPLGGQISTIRPSNFARPLIRASRLGLQVELITPTTTLEMTTGEPTFGNLFFAPAVSDGRPTTVVGNLAAGTDSLYLFFDYENMTPQTVYELRVTIDGRPSQIFSLAPVRWSGGTRGLWYIGSSNQTWPNGVYEFRLFINGRAAGTLPITIGGDASPRPILANVAFGIEDTGGNILGNGFVLPTGNVATASFIYQNIIDGMEWTAIWYKDGVEIPGSRTTETWSRGSTGTRRISIIETNGLTPGTYRLEMFLDGFLAARSDFTIAGAQIGPLPEVFINSHFAVASNSQLALSAPPITNITNRVDEVYALFDWQQIAPGTIWTLRWWVDDTLFYEQSLPWSGFETGENFLMRLTAPGELPDGTYRLDLSINNFRLATTEVLVGIGQLPIDRFASTEGVQLRGRIIDSDTGEGLPGATLILLSEDFSIEDFEWRQDQIFATALTDREGRFQVDRPLELDVPYSVLIAVEGYLPIAADGITVTQDTENPLDVTIYLTRD